MAIFDGKSGDFWRRPPGDTGCSFAIQLYQRNFLSVFQKHQGIRTPQKMAGNQKLVFFNLAIIFPIFILTIIFPIFVLAKDGERDEAKVSPRKSNPDLKSILSGEAGRAAAAQTNQNLFDFESLSIAQPPCHAGNPHVRVFKLLIWRENWNWEGKTRQNAENKQTWFQGKN